MIALQISPETIHALGEEVRGTGLLLLVVVIVGACCYQFLKHPPWGPKRD